MRLCANNHHPGMAGATGGRKPASIRARRPSKSLEFKMQFPAASQRAQKFQERFFFAGFELLEFFHDAFRFAPMTKNSVEKRDRGAVMHQPGMQTHAP